MYLSNVKAFNCVLTIRKMALVFAIFSLFYLNESSFSVGGLDRRNAVGEKSWEEKKRKRKRKRTRKS